MTEEGGAPRGGAPDTKDGFWDFIRELLSSDEVPSVPERFLDDERLKETADYIAALRDCACRFASGDFSGDIKGGGFLVGRFKELQAGLMGLKRFADRMAAGDYSQRLDNAGEFYESFNRMSGEFREALQSLRGSEADLRVLSQKLRISEERWKLAVSCTQEGIWDIDLVARTAYFSPRFWEIIRRPVVHENIPFDPVAWGASIHPDDLARWAGVVNASSRKTITDEGRQYTEFRVIGGDGKYRWVGAHHVVVVNSEGIPCRFVGTCEDIQEMREREDEIRRQATLDQLTKLPNRYLYNDRFLQKMVVAKRNASSLVLILWDLDGFKWVNDTYGHLAGDRLLVIVANLMRQSLRETDTLARFGGDEFVMLLSCPTDHEEEVVSRATLRVFRAMSEPLDIGSEKVTIGASCGIAFFPLHTNSGDQLFNLADKALYAAKRTGKNKAVIWSPEMYGKSFPGGADIFPK
ncbi:MAG: diguanylate cyclase [Synergistaceae bacterium]|jgi:diguanylate cyclase (GGDEF)-like protein|nr:diguanylate cyclase [Synergistaceae bacterium]